MSNAAAAIATRLANRGYITKRSQAEVVGAGRSDWTRWVDGKRKPKVATVRRWLANAAERGVELWLEVRIEGVEAHVVEVER